MGFTEQENGFVRFCFSHHFENREDVLSEISKLSPTSFSDYLEMSNLELEHHCSPVSLTANHRLFLVPSQSGYALNLIDMHQSANDLFGGDPSVLLRWDNVYYRKKTHHKMLNGPGRILWYVSGTTKEIVAISRLDEVVIDTPKELYKRFKSLGTLDWKQLFEMCESEPLRELMVLRFSHTFSFRERISLETMRSVHERNSTKLVLQSPSRIPMETFRQLFGLGFSEQE